MGCQPTKLSTTNTYTNCKMSDSSHNDVDIENKHDYESILSSPGKLKIPDTFATWFPRRNAHKKASKLFKWHEKIADGETGSLYEIEYKSQICAVKQLDKSEKWSKMLFQTEARVLSKLQHCGIIGFIDMFFDERYYYLVEQKADFDLYYVMKQQGQLSERKTRNITYALLETINFIHKKRLVHRDLKPENIVFLAENTNQPILVDFGDAEVAKKDKIYTEFVGTPPYMSPERLGEHRGWQLKKSDIWAIGVIAYEMYCGKPCFEGDTQEQIFGRISRAEWSWPNDGTPPSDDMKDFINLCLSANAKNRPSAKESLLHKWFDVKRQEETDEEQQLKLNVISSAPIEMEDANN